ncbi:heat shock protein HslJ [Hasllibacter halocynthiae]|uniref:Heat shock protein HslJ n=1 Tax=Hasllibacter halocynthiae TaxID=595589 RepID=A0A2T0X3J4_9RHOB|nr:META domain-containing protein [Hasllibacter halocynthiae]PRY93434.1 heat shock protein HslJ [Hasllibacter halocynthiae]
MVAGLLCTALGLLCPDETLAGHGGGGEWRLETLDGAPLGAQATLSLGPGGALSGRAPCNAFSGRQTAPYPWFEASALAATRRACPALDAEARFLAALEAMTEAEVLGGVLVLRNRDGGEMLFRRP